ncbi:hypothetical protein ACI3PL_23265, partial [Lacticaseibacillus paracasei]
MRNLGIFQFEVITNNFIQIGMVLENVLLALALALRTQKSQLAGESALRQAVSEQQHQLADLQHTEHALADQLQA